YCVVRAGKRRPAAAREHARAGNERGGQVTGRAARGKRLTASPKARVLIVDDAVVVRKALTDALARDPALEVVGTASNGRLALTKFTQLRPDIILLDIEMPEMNGLETVPEIRKLDRRVPIIMFSTRTARGAEATLEALYSGATDYVTKPSTTDIEST